MRFTSTGVAAAAMVAFSALGVTAFHTGIVGGSPSTATKPATIQMYANVDQLGDLGSHVGAKSAKLHISSPIVYEVTFSRPIGNCAAEVQAGFAGGNLQAGPYASEVVIGDAKTFDIDFLDTSKNQYTTSAFMITVTCPS